MPRVSIMMPVYNGARYLGQAIESALGQTYADCELLVVDDGSTDGSLTVAEEYVRRFAPRVRLLSRPDLKSRDVSVARNLAVENAGGELIAFLDADDLWLPERLEVQIRELDNHPEVGLIYAKAVCIDENGQEITRPTGVYGLHGELGKGVPNIPFDAYEGFVNFGHDGYPDFEWHAPVPTVMVRRHLLLEAGGFATGLKLRGGEDRIMWALIARKAPFLFLPKRLACYRVHGANWTSRQTSMTTLDVPLEILGRVAAHFHEMDQLTAEAVSQFIHYYWRLKRVPVHRRLRKIREVVRLLGEYGMLSEVLPRYVVRRIRRRLRRMARLG